MLLCVRAWVTLGVNNARAALWRFLARTRSYLKAEWNAKVGDGEFDESEWTNYSDNANTPTQNNSFDCGVFTSQFMRCLSMAGGGDAVPFGFSQHDMHYFRKRMAYEIATSALLAD
jgi:sentrin-specific protease 1